MTLIEETADSVVQEYHSIYTDKDITTGKLIDILLRFRRENLDDGEAVTRAITLARTFIESELN